MRWSIFWFAGLVAAASAAKAQVAALQTDCRLGGPQQNGSYQFVATCAGRSESPDGRFAVIQRAYQHHQPTIELQDGRGRVVSRLRSMVASLTLAADGLVKSVTTSGDGPVDAIFMAIREAYPHTATLQLFQIVGGVRLNVRRCRKQRLRLLRPDTRVFLLIW